MKHQHEPPKAEVFWYKAGKKPGKNLTENISVDVAIIGGGMAGLSAAQAFDGSGKKVVVLESGFCGVGASGKTSGFITPDSELELSHLIENYGKEEAKKIWTFVTSGVDDIRKNIETFNISCDYQVQDSYFISNSKKAFSKVKREHEARISLGYKSTLYTKEEVETVLGSKNYYGAVRYPDTFGINSFSYCQAMKEILEQKGITIYEESPVVEIGNTFVKTNLHTVIANNIIVAADRFLPDLKLLAKDVYHAQTFLGISKPLTDEQVRAMFTGDKLMVWDTDLIYQYYRVVEGNRLLIGAASMFYTYTPKEHPTPQFIFKKMHNYILKKFPEIDIEIEYTWPGMLGVSKDFVPLAGRDKMMPNVYFIGGATGLPWAAALGKYIAEKIEKGRNDYDSEFSPDRHFTFGKAIQGILTTPVTFAISHGFTKYFK